MAEESGSDKQFAELFKQFNSSGAKTSSCNFHGFSAGIGGDLKFCDAFFAFLRRNTRLLHSTGAVNKIQEIALKVREK